VRERYGHITKKRSDTSVKDGENKARNESIHYWVMRSGEFWRRRERDSKDFMRNLVIKKGACTLM
jgi:hypothetical protein